MELKVTIDASAAVELTNTLIRNCFLTCVDFMIDQLHRAESEGADAETLRALAGHIVAYIDEMISTLRISDAERDSILETQNFYRFLRDLYETDLDPQSHSLQELEERAKTFDGKLGLRLSLSWEPAENVIDKYEEKLGYLLMKKQ